MKRVWRNWKSFYSLEFCRTERTATVINPNGAPKISINFGKQKLQSASPWRNGLQFNLIEAAKVTLRLNNLARSNAASLTNFLFVDGAIVALDEVGRVGVDEVEQTAAIRRVGAQREPGDRGVEIGRSFDHIIDSGRSGEV